MASEINNFESSYFDVFHGQGRQTLLIISEICP